MNEISADAPATSNHLAGKPPVTNGLAKIGIARSIATVAALVTALLGALAAPALAVGVTALPRIAVTANHPTTTAHESLVLAISCVATFIAISGGALVFALRIRRPTDVAPTRPAGDQTLKRNSTTSPSAIT